MARVCADNCAADVIKPRCWVARACAAARQVGGRCGSILGRVSLVTLARMWLLISRGFLRVQKMTHAVDGDHAGGRGEEGWLWR
jgi:hypothetical protein